MSMHQKIMMMMMIMSDPTKSRLFQFSILLLFCWSNNVNGNIITSLFNFTTGWNWMNTNTSNINSTTIISNNKNNTNRSVNEYTDDDGYSNEQYLYHIKTAQPIIDYEPPADGKNILHPTFIYGMDNDHPPQYPRVVEFYAPWCPHVRSEAIQAREIFIFVVVVVVDVLVFTDFLCFTKLLP